MLSDEEKQTIDYLKARLYGNEGCKFIDVAQSDLRIFLKLVENLQKEIEELKEQNKTLKNLQNDTNRLYTEMIERKNYFERELQKLEDKIKAKIEEYKKLSNNVTMQPQIYLYIIDVLQSLLKEE